LCSSFVFLVDSLLHGCPPALAEPPAIHGERLTLLVNVWRNHTPVGLKPLPKSTALRLRCRVGAARQLLRKSEPGKQRNRSHTQQHDQNNRSCKKISR